MFKALSRLAIGLSYLVIVATLAACGGGGGGGSPSYVVSITVTTAVANGESFVFGLETQRATASAQNAVVSFSQTLAGGSSYSVTQISGPRPCTLTNASGTLSADVTVSANCSGTGAFISPTTYSGNFSANVNRNNFVASDVALTSLGGFVVDTANSVPGDVTKYINGSGTARVTTTSVGCSFAQDVLFSASLWLWHPSSPSAGGAMRSTYALMVDQASVPLTNCGSVVLGASVINLAMDCANSMPNTVGLTSGGAQPYTDPSQLQGSVDLSCTPSAGGGISSPFTVHFQWSLLGQ